MQYTQSSVAKAIEAVPAFLDKHAAVLGPVAVSGARKKIEEVSASLDAHGREQEDRAMAARMATVTRLAAREALITEHMQPIAHVAAAELANFGELTALHMPRLNITDQTLIQKARAMASAAKGHEPVFSQGLASASFDADLEAAADALAAAVTARLQAVASRQKATAGLAADSRAARKRLRVMDRLVRAVIKKDTTLVAEWDSTTKIAKKSGVPRVAVKPDDVAPATPAPAAEQQAA